jgi:hypothetical protein
MRRNRRMVLIDRVIPFLAAGVGLIALAGAVVVQLNAEARSKALMSEIGALRETVEQMGARTEALALAQDDGTASGLLALQDRMVGLEEQLSGALAAAPLAEGLPPGTDVTAATEVAEIDPNLPSTDCIPLGTRFVALPDESYPMCQSTTVLKVGAITGDTVLVEGAGPIVETGFGKIVGTECTVMVFSADIEGFAEMRVNCS